MRAGGPVMRGWRGIPGNVRGALWILVAGVMFALVAAVVKDLAPRIDPFQAALFRAVGGLLSVAPLVMRGGLAVVRTRQPALHFWRGLFGVGSMLCVFYAYAHLPLADAVTLSFARPLFLVVLAVLFLGERIRVRRSTATVIGFIGVVVMLRPAGTIDPAALVALAGAAVMAGAAVFVKKLAVSESLVTMIFWFGIASTVACLPAAALVWVWPTPSEWAALAAIGALGATGQVFFLWALRVGEATAVIPFDYAQILYAAALGFVLFGEAPDWLTWAGATLIVAATSYIAVREARVKRSRR
jgi:drug/metabolite transporter (DMT)-like permease